MAKKLDYRKLKPCGKCKQCTINLWTEHDGYPAPHALPCPMENCQHQKAGKLLSFDRSATGSPIALLTG